MAEFKKLSDVEVVAEPAESANVLIEEDGVIKKAPKTAVGGSGGGGIVLTCKYNSSEEKVIEQPVYDYEQLKSAILSGERVVIVATNTPSNNIELLTPAVVSEGNMGRYIRFEEGSLTLTPSGATLTY